MRSKTPTAAADLCLSWFVEVREHISALSSNLADRLSTRVERDGERFRRLELRLVQSVEASLANRNQYLLTLSRRIDHSYMNQFKKMEQVFTGLSHQLEMKSKEQLYRYEKRLGELDLLLAKRDPYPWLMQGWTQLSKNNKKISSIDDIHQGDSLEARLIDGIVELKVEKLQKKQKIEQRKDQHD